MTTNKSLIFILGTRPEIIKMAPVIMEARKRGIKADILSTGQHKQMLTPLYDWFELKPTWDLEIMKPNQSLAFISSKSIEEIDKIFQKEKPSGVVVQGDTTTAACGAYTAFINKIPVTHVEAGLRTYDIHSPFPEEHNRRWISLATSISLCPTSKSLACLKKENLFHSKNFVVGNTVIDALLWSERKLQTLSLHSYENLKDYALITLHRRENFENMKKLFLTIQKMAQQLSIKFLWPLHMNPNIRSLAFDVFGVPRDFSSDQPVLFKGVYFISPLDYLLFIQAMKNARFIITDSGGVQEEAPALGKPVLIMRENTERIESVKAGSAKIIGNDMALLQKMCTLLGKNSARYKTMSKKRYPYGKGNSSKKILDILTQRILK